MSVPDTKAACSRWSSAKPNWPKSSSCRARPPTQRRGQSCVACPSHIGDFVHTITFDNGKEFAAHQDIAHALKAKIFFATPYHAWERGLNENTNGLIRDFFPKGTDFSTIANAEVAKVERLLNARPRKSLGFRSPQEVFDSLAHS